MRMKWSCPEKVRLLIFDYFQGMGPYNWCAIGELICSKEVWKLICCCQWDSVFSLVKPRGHTLIFSCSMNQKGLMVFEAVLKGNEWGFDRNFLRKYFYGHSGRIHFPLVSWSLKTQVTPFPLKFSSSLLICPEHRKYFCEHKAVGDKATQLHFHFPSFIGAVLHFLFLLLKEKECHKKLLRWHLKFSLATAASWTLEESRGRHPLFVFALFQNKRKQQYLQIDWAGCIIFPNFPSKSLNSWRTKW